MIQQNWNNVLQYIKRHLGADFNFLELSDDEIIDGIKQEVLPRLTQYHQTALKKWIPINTENTVPSETIKDRFGPGVPAYAYDIPTDDPIIRIHQVYYPESLLVTDGYLYAMLLNWRDAIDLTILNNYIDIIRKLTPLQTWEFLPPKTILFSKEVIGSIIVICYVTIHQTLDTMPADVYYHTFLPLCLVHTIRWIISRREKYESLATPFGQINLNIDRLEARANQLESDVLQKLEQMPPEKLVEIF